MLDKNMATQPGVEGNKKFLLRHLGNMGDLVFLAPPILAGLKKHHPGCHTTLVTAWGYKDHRGRWGKRNQGGHGISLMMTNPHLDQLIHWHDTKLSLEATLCREDGQSFPTWNQTYYKQRKHSGQYNRVIELDTGLSPTDNPLVKLFAAAHLPADSDPAYRLYLTAYDRTVAAAVLDSAPRPRIVLLESLCGNSTRSWDPAKAIQLERAIERRCGTPPLWFGAAHTWWYRGRPLTLRENIALLTRCDLGIGVLSGPLHFAAAVGLPTLTLYCDQPLHRAAPAYFLNRSISDPRHWHRTLLGPDPDTFQIHKYAQGVPHLTPREERQQHFRSWQKPGRQATKSCLSAITVDEVMRVLDDMLSTATL